jgi:phosphoesterase RecJ-like protein
VAPVCTPTTIAPPLEAPVAPELQDSITRLLDHVRTLQRVVVTSHRGPDADAISSVLACCHLFEAMGLNALPYHAETVPEVLRFLPGAERFVTHVDRVDAYDALVVVDCTGWGRLSEGAEQTVGTLPVIAIDHHRTYDPDFAALLVRDPEAASTTVVIYRLVAAAGVPLERDLALCIYAGLHADTGSCRYASADAVAMEVARNVLRTGISTWEVASALYERQPERRVRLLGRVLSSLQRSRCGRVAVLVVRIEDLDACGAGHEDADGFVNHARGIDGVEVAVQLREITPTKWGASLRSRGRLDVSQMAERFGGGGHQNAAGCSIDGSLEDVLRALYEGLAVFGLDTQP